MRLKRQQRNAALLPPPKVGLDFESSGSVINMFETQNVEWEGLNFQTALYLKTLFRIGTPSDHGKSIVEKMGTLHSSS